LGGVFCGCEGPGSWGRGEASRRLPQEVGLEGPREDQAPEAGGDGGLGRLVVARDQQVGSEASCYDSDTSADERQCTAAFAVGDGGLKFGNRVLVVAVSLVGFGEVGQAGVGEIARRGCGEGGDSDAGPAPLLVGEEWRLLGWKVGPCGGLSALDAHLPLADYVVLGIEHRDSVGPDAEQDRFASLNVAWGDLDIVHAGCGLVRDAQDDQGSTARLRRGGRSGLGRELGLQFHNPLEGVDLGRCLRVIEVGILGPGGDCFLDHVAAFIRPGLVVHEQRVRVQRVSLLEQRRRLLVFALFEGLLALLVEFLGFRLVDFHRVRPGAVGCRRRSGSPLSSLRQHHAGQEDEHQKRDDLHASLRGICGATPGPVVCLLTSDHFDPLFS
jgi:hypothetical protein